MEQTLLRRKLDHTADNTAANVKKLFGRNRKAGLKPTSWESIKTSKKFKKALKDCPELNNIYDVGYDQEMDVLYEFAKLMTVDEFDDIQKNDADLTERLLGGPHRMFIFPLNAECKKEVKRLYKLTWGHDEPLLRRKLNSLREEADIKTEALFAKNLKLGIKPNKWADIDHSNAADLLNSSVEFYEAIVPGCLAEIAMLNEAAALMEESEFKEILVCDDDLTEKLLNGPHQKFTFSLNAECQKEIKRLEKLREEDSISSLLSSKKLTHNYPPKEEHEQIAISIIRGEKGLDFSHQERFPQTAECVCGGEGRIAFVVFEPMIAGDNISYVRDAHENEASSMWVHDAVAVAIYLCKKCLKPIALMNQC